MRSIMIYWIDDNKESVSDGLPIRLIFFYILIIIIFIIINNQIIQFIIVKMSS